jgi:phage tail P2-like protein
MSDLPTLLPPNARSVERDLEQVMARLQGLSLPVSVLWNPDLCPENLLPYLAWAMSIEIWDDTWTAEEKRAMIKSSVAIHRVKGTRGAVERALVALGFRIDLSEWFETGDPVHTFRLDAFGPDVFETGFSIDAALQATITRIIDSVKPVRSHFVLRIGVRHDVDIAVRTGSRRRAEWSRIAGPVVPTFVSAPVVATRSGHRAVVVETAAHVFTPHEEIAA